MPGILGYQIGWFDFAQPWWLLGMLLLAPMVWFWRNSKAPGGPSRGGLALVLRCVLVLALLLTLAGTRLARDTKGVCVVFLLDQSASVPAEARTNLRTRLKLEIDKMTTDDRFAVIEFAGDAVLGILPSPKGTLPESVQVMDPGRSDIGRGLRLALASFPPDRQKRIVLLSDGNQNLGDALREARIAAVNGVEIETLDARFLGNQSRHEVMIEQVVAPPRVQRDSALSLRVIVSSDQEQDADLFISRSGETITSQPIRLKAGTNVYDLTDRIKEGGFQQYAVTVNPRKTQGYDTFTANNTAYAYTMVDAPGRVLLVQSRLGADTSGSIQEALTSRGVKVEVIAPERLPLSLRDYGPVDCVVLQNVNRYEMTPAQIQIMAQWVRDAGGGLVMVGGDQSFGPGGYKDTPLEEISPVAMDIKRQKHLASMALAIVMDKSGSMGASAVGGAAGLMKMDLANQGSAETVKLLSPSDMAMVGAVDTEVKWMLGAKLLNMNPGNKSQLIKATLSNAPGGGGIYCLTALEHAYRLVTNPGVDVMARHVILFADANDSEQQNGCIELAEKNLKSHGVTLTVIGLGTKADSDFAFLSDLAKRGKGRFYITDNAMDLPRYFIKETFIASRNAFVEKKDGFALHIYDSPLLEGFQTVGVPKVRGYVGTTLKPRATLAAHGLEADDPVLAHWNIGLGRAVAFTSDSGLRWCGDWTGWEGFAKFWTQTVRWASRSQKSSPIVTSTTVDGNVGKIRVTAIASDGKPINNLPLKAKILPPDGREALDTVLVQTSPGEYEAQFPVSGKGAYLVNVVDGAQGGVLDTAAAVLSYPAEFRDLQPNAGLLRQIAQVTGGDYITQLDTLFRPRDIQVQTFKDMFQWLLIISASGLLLDVAWRRLNPKDWFQSPRRVVTATVAGQAVAVLQQIKAGRGSVEAQRDNLRQRVPARPTPPPASVTPVITSSPSVEPPATPAAPATPASTSSYGDRLMHAKKRAADQIRKSAQDGS